MWQARIKLDTGEWYRRSTGTDDVEEAKDKALELFFVARDRSKSNLPQQTRRFRQLAQTVHRELEELRDTGNWKSVYGHYQKVINAHLIPYFGAYKVDNLRKPFEGYVTWLAKKLGREPAESTLRTHFAALNLVFERALHLHYVTPQGLPNLKLRGRKSEQGATFEHGEYVALINKLRAWCKKPSKNLKTTELKVLLYDYVTILAHTGIRHGEEMLRIKWRHLFWGKDVANDQRILHVTVTTKKGRGSSVRSRMAVARWTAVSAFKRIHKRHATFKKLTFDELLARKIDEPVFALSDGTLPKSLPQVFDRFLAESGMQLGSSSDKKRTLYSFRHYYATMALTRENPIPINVLAMQMGTSIAMIQQHYSHLKLIDVSEQLAGKRWGELASDVSEEKI